MTDLQVSLKIEGLMLFTSLTQRIVAFAIALLLVRWLAGRIRSTGAREGLLLAASYLFYISWGPRFLGILVFSSVVNYFLGNFLRRHVTRGRLWLGIGFNLLLLGFFKYLPLAAEMSPHNPVLGRFSHILLPLGVSFWTFQALSYLFELYREEELNPTLLEFCLYMAFWPTVISGPICRLPDMLPQFRQPVAPSREEMGGGMQRILMGLMMMAASQVMATGVGPGGGVDTGFDLPARSLGAGDVWCLALGYGFQLFFNFAGYTHIVVGVARLFGIQLAENFNLPYLSRSPSEFWTRWHMSLSFWIRDYVFFPLATMRAEMWWRNACLVLAMFVFGVWHGGNAHYALYGIYHGLLLVAHRQWQRLGVAARVRLPQYVTTPLAWLGTFMAVTLGWILFRAQSLDQAAIMLQGALRPASYGHHVLQKSFIGIILFAAVVYFLVVAISSALDRQARKIARAEEEALSTPAPAHDRMLTLLARHRWVWVGPIALVFLLYAYLLIRPQGSLVGPMLYQIF